MLFSVVAAPIYIPTNSVGGIHFLYSIYYLETLTVATVVGDGSILYFWFAFL